MTDNDHFYIDMNETHSDLTSSVIEQNMSTMTDQIVMVTAFYDIGRGDWNSIYKRSSMTYLLAAKHYLGYNYQMIFFIDSKYVDLFREWVQQSPYYENKTVISIDIEWLNQNSFVWQQLHHDKQILLSDNYRQYVKNRIENKYPENMCAEYNAITNAKVDFMTFAIKNFLKESPHTFVCWTDFGYFNSVYRNDETKFPKNVLDIRKFNINKLNFTVLSKIIEKDHDMIYTLKTGREVFATGLFGGSVPLILEFQKLCHEVLLDLHNHGISDDDQHTCMRVCFDQPNLFQLYIDVQKWPDGLNYFQKEQ